jgi:hypothetical protein
MVKVLLSPPGQNTEKPWLVMTKPGGIGETEQMIVNPTVGGTVMLQVLLMPPGQDSEVPWAVMTKPAGMGELLQIINGAALACGAVATAEIAPIMMAVIAAGPRRRATFAVRVFARGRRSRCRTCSNLFTLVPG